MRTFLKTRVSIGVTIFMFKAGMVWAKVSSTVDLEEVSIRCGGPWERVLKKNPGKCHLILV